MDRKADVEERKDAPASRLDGFFGVTAAGSTTKTEVIAGFTTFMTMAYILFVNPTILGALPDRDGRSLGFPLVLTSTALQRPGLIVWNVTVYNPDLDPDGDSGVRIVSFLAKMVSYQK
jgi:hypothetical protein